jgi:hypothetical protein
MDEGGATAPFFIAILGQGRKNKHYENCDYFRPIGFRKIFGQQGARRLRLQLH